jgi:hypothetical protein
LEEFMVLSQIGSVLLTIPVVLMLVIFVFRLDVLIYRTPARQTASTRRPRFANFNSDGAMTDPDGRVPVPVRGRRSESRF